MADTPFMKFWAALNEQLASDGYPQITFGPAHRLYAATVEEARRDSMQFALKQAA